MKTILLWDKELLGSCLYLFLHFQLFSVAVANTFVHNTSVDHLVHAVNYLDRRFLYHFEDPYTVALSCSARRMGIRPFRIAPGFVSEYKKPDDLVLEYQKIRIVHYCPNVIRNMNFHLRVQSNLLQDCKLGTSSNDAFLRDVGDRRVFRATMFLHRIRNKQFTFYGDSINRQIFLDLAAELNPYQTEFSYMEKNKTSVVTVNTTNTFDLPDLHRVFSKRTYAAYNASIVYYDDGYANRFLYDLVDRNIHAWNIELMRSDFILVGVGAWFKPWFEPVFDRKDYYREMFMKQQYLNDSLWWLRQTFALKIPHAKIIWRLNAHVGMIDELSSIGQAQNLTFDTSPSGYYRHDGGGKWRNLSYGAVWPMYYNRLYKPVAQYYGDAVLDYWQISIQYLRYMEQLVQSIKVNLKAASASQSDEKQKLLEHDSLSDILTKETRAALHTFLQSKKYQESPELLNDYFPVMTDSLHYCPGTVPRAGVFMLHELIGDMIARELSLQQATLKNYKRQRKTYNYNSKEPKQQKGSGVVSGSVRIKNRSARRKKKQSQQTLNE